MKTELEKLRKEAEKSGATSAAVISSCDIIVKESLAALCNGEFPCPNYGVAASCPPHIEGPKEFKMWQKNSDYSIALKIELPTSVMFSDERKGIMKLLHEVVSRIERKAVLAGFPESRGFAGGSCKDLFCADHKNCIVTTENKPCRHIDSARPSMSGFGIDVVELMKSSGWSSEKAEESETDKTSWVAGLVLIA